MRNKFSSSIDFDSEKIAVLLNFKSTTDNFFHHLSVMCCTCSEENIFKLSSLLGLCARRVEEKVESVSMSRHHT